MEHDSSLALMFGQGLGIDDRGLRSRHHQNISRPRSERREAHSCNCSPFHNSNSPCRHQSVYTAPPSLLFLTIRILTSPQIAYKHYIRALSRWPKDALRPECQFQDALRKRLDSRYQSSSPVSTADERADLEQANILYSLLENRYSRKVCRFLPT